MEKIEELKKINCMLRTENLIMDIHNMADMEDWCEVFDCVAVVLEKWSEDCKKDSISPTSAEDYKQSCKVWHIKHKVSAMIIRNLAKDYRNTEP